jgi:uroporphyrinogen decarboxylase
MEDFFGDFKGLRIGAVITPDLVGVIELIQAHGGSCRSLVFQRKAGQRQTRVGRVANQLLVGEIDILVFNTAAGVTGFLDQAFQLVERQRLLDSLTDMMVVAGSKSAANVFFERDINVEISVDSSSWRDVLVALDQHCALSNKTLGVEASSHIHCLRAGLEARGAKVIDVDVFESGDDDDFPAAQEFFEGVESGDIEAVLFSSPEVVAQYCRVAQRTSPAWQRLNRRIVFAVGRDTRSLLDDGQIRVTRTSQGTDFAEAIEGFANCMTDINREQARSHASLSGPQSGSSDAAAPWYDSPFMKACRGERTDVTPVWMMRQAGRYMEEYREVRSKVTFLELCSNPQLCSEVMCTAVNRLGVDAAIIFSDLLPILVPMGMNLEFVQGDGPVIHNPIRTPADVNRVSRLESTEPLQFVMETVRQTRNDLPADMPLIGFAGAPFTLASYMIEGGSSRNYANTKQLMRSDSSAWDELMRHLSHSLKVYLKGQVDAGAQVLQLFDSWAGCLSFEDYRTFVLPYVKDVIESLPPEVPVINFATGNPTLLPFLADTPASVIGIDWRIRLDDAWQQVGFGRAVQGNLDPTVLLSDVDVIRHQVQAILDQAANRPGHIFNLGHGILPQTPVENAIALVELVHELSQR